MFSVINVARLLNIDPDEALGLTNKKFIERIKFIEEKLAISHNSLENATIDELNNLWEQSKEK